MLGRRPWLALNPAFESGWTVSEQVGNGVLDPEATNIFRDPTGKEIAFHRHQTDAFEIANRRELVTSSLPVRRVRTASEQVRLEPMTGIEPAYSAWEADVLPLNYIGR